MALGDGSATPTGRRGRRRCPGPGRPAAAPAGARCSTRSAALTAVDSCARSPSSLPAGPHCRSTRTSRFGVRQEVENNRLLAGAIVAGPNKVMRRVAPRPHQLGMPTSEATRIGTLRRRNHPPAMAGRLSFPPSAVAELAELASHLHVGAHAPEVRSAHRRERTDGAQTADAQRDILWPRGS